MPQTLAAPSSSADDDPACRLGSRLIAVGSTEVCDHFEAVVHVDPPLAICSACDEIGARWEHLRQCLTCGRTSCCNLSPNRHATGHFEVTGHPMIRSAEPGEDWRWCYPDDRLYMAGAADDEAAEP